MKFTTVAVSAALIASCVNGFTAPRTQRATSSLNMVLEMPKAKKISKLENLKVVSDHLVKPLEEVRCCPVGNLFLELTLLEEGKEMSMLTATIFVDFNCDGDSCTV